MNKYLIRYNKSAGEPGRGSSEHVWRVFENGREYLARHVRINVHSWSEQTGPDWNIERLPGEDYSNDIERRVWVLF
jgi:hypothetical protein